MLEMVKTIALSPAQACKNVAVVNVRLWKTTFWEAWEPLPFDIKLAWIAFVSQTIAVLTLIEIFALKR